MTDFNPRLREGGDLIPSDARNNSRLFQSTPPRGRRHTVPGKYGRCRSISIHASAREATGYLNAVSYGATISIHASAREATCPPEVKKACQTISIHASAREATTLTTQKNIVVWHFNPRLREGGDKTIGAYLRSSDISIHASAREATALITKIHLKHHISFQHTVHKSPFNVNYPFQ